MLPELRDHDLVLIDLNRTDAKPGKIFPFAGGDLIGVKRRDLAGSHPAQAISVDREHAS